MINNLEVHYLGALFFGLAVLHTFFVGSLRKWSHRFPENSFKHSLLHLLGEVEIVFGLWAALFSILLCFRHSVREVVDYIEGLHFTEPIFVFCIMIISSTKPVLWLAQVLLAGLSRSIYQTFKWPAAVVDLAVLMVLGPLLGSLITESGAITVTALLLSKMIKKSDLRFNYTLLAVLFVNISVGGALTPFAAPPILMVASKWNWGFQEVFSQFGSHAIVIVFINALGLVMIYSKTIRENLTPFKDVQNNREKMPLAIVAVHYLFLILTVLSAHHPTLAIALLLFFTGVAMATPQYQSAFKFKESLLVAFFLGGLIFFGPFQGWWVSPVLQVVTDRGLFLLATALTAITDNAALTYLGSQVVGLSDVSKYFLVAGAITGGGLTIIANAPNPAGFSILQKFFPEGLQAGKLFLAALAPTFVAIAVYGIFIW